MSIKQISQNEKIKLPNFKRSQISMKSCTNLLKTDKKAFKKSTVSHDFFLDTTAKKKKQGSKFSEKRSKISEKTFVLSSVTQQLKKNKKNSNINSEELKSNIIEGMNRKRKGAMLEEEMPIMQEIVHDEKDPDYFNKEANSKMSNGHSSILSNRSSYFSQLSKMTLKLPQILKELEKKNLTPEKIFERWPIYFSEIQPRFSKKNLAQILVLSLLHKLIVDFENQNLSYVQWRRKDGAHPIEVFFDYKIIKNDDESGDLLNTDFDQKLNDMFKFFEQLPSEYLNSMNLALDNFNAKVLKKEKKRVITRIKNLPKIINISDINTSKINKFVKFRCQIIAISAPKLFIRSLVKIFFNFFNRKRNVMIATKHSLTTSKKAFFINLRNVSTSLLAVDQDFLTIKLKLKQDFTKELK